MLLHSDETAPQRQISVTYLPFTLLLNVRLCTQTTLAPWLELAVYTVTR